MKKELLTRTECDVLRGIAIIGIFLHNYCHWLRPVVQENEYQYFKHNVDWFYQVLHSHWTGLLPFHILSFFLQYGKYLTARHNKSLIAVFQRILYVVCDH